MSGHANGPTTLAELAADLGPDGQALLSAGSVDELHQLLLAWGSRRTTCVDAVLLLRAHHTGAPDALETARLMLTDRRWDRLTSRLVRGLAGTGLLSDADLDKLAVELLSAEFLDHRLDDWQSGPDVVIELPRSVGQDDDRDELDREPATDLPDRALLRRRIPPPLRRWGAARAAARSLAPPERLLAWADALPARDAAELVRGMLDELDGLPKHQREPLLERALVWPARTVRISALQHLLERGEAHRVRELAACDSDARVRDAFAPRDEQVSLF